MLVPVTAMPIAGILPRIASEDMLNIPLLKSAGDIVFGNMDILFALSAVVAFAKAKDKVFPMVASLLSILVLKSTLSVLDESINIILIIPVGIVFFMLYFFTFCFLIQKFDLKTLGHEDASLMNLDKIKQMGVRGVTSLSDTSVQIIIGFEVHQTVLYDIDAMRVAQTGKFCTLYAQEHAEAVSVSYTTDIETAFREADFLFAQIRLGCN